MVYGLWFRSSFFWEGVGEEGRGGGVVHHSLGLISPRRKLRLEEVSCTTFVPIRGRASFNGFR